MLRILGGPKRLCDGLTRRDLLHVGSLGLMGLGLSNRGFAETGTPIVSGGFGKAKSCILLYLYGAPSQLETFDPKPDAPEGIRGELTSIPSSVPGLDVCALLPNMARVMDKVTVIRSVSHAFPIHGVAFATTGINPITPPMELNPRDPLHWPFIGSVVDYVEQGKRGNAPRGAEVPKNLVLPWAFSSRRVGEVARAGPYGGFLGSAWDPTYCEFVGEGTRTAKKTLTDKVWEDLEPYRGITPESRFQLGAIGNIGAELTLDRMDRRRALLEQLEDSRKSLDAAAPSTGVDSQRAQSYNLIGSYKFRRAFSLEEEHPSTR